MPQAQAAQEIGRKLADQKLVVCDIADDSRWTVYRDKYDHSGATVSATHLGLQCAGYFCRYEKCKHIWAVEFYMADQGKEIVMPHAFEAQLPYLNSILQEDTYLELVPFQDGWLIENQPEGLPISEWKHRTAKTDISRLVSMVVEHATETKAKIFVKIDHSPFTGRLLGRPGEPIGPGGVIEILTKTFHFKSVEKHNHVELFIFDSEYLSDPYTGVLFATELREFLDEEEAHIEELGGLKDVDEFRFRKRELLKKLRGN